MSKLADHKMYTIANVLCQTMNVVDIFANNVVIVSYERNPDLAKQAEKEIKYFLGKDKTVRNWRTQKLTVGELSEREQNAIGGMLITDDSQEIYRIYLSVN